MFQSNTLYALNLHNVLCENAFNKKKNNNMILNYTAFLLTHS